MVTRTLRVDDITGEEGAEPVTFALKGQAYTIDLAPENMQRLGEVLAEFVEAATPVADKPQRGRRPGGGGGGGGGRSRGADAQNRERMDRIRQWGREQGYEVNDRGRPKKDLVDAYNAAHPQDEPSAEGTAAAE